MRYLREELAMAQEEVCVYVTQAQRWRAMAGLAGQVDICMCESDGECVCEEGKGGGGGGEDDLFAQWRECVKGLKSRCRESERKLEESRREWWKLLTEIQGEEEEGEGEEGEKEREGEEEALAWVRMQEEYRGLLELVKSHAHV